MFFRIVFRRQPHEILLFFSILPDIYSFAEELMIFYLYSSWVYLFFNTVSLGGGSEAISFLI
ncbi:hypothetical protein A0U92_13765 [Acetobacter aceti]|uniref:Uncharacterized protein n=1 Tax=Acetobacter aceti TaxID=435 RepID=A0A1U9KIL9_ACEAC|nr:hypothetical protein A0U92_13765 [Acetobacter aceti]